MSRKFGDVKDYIILFPYKTTARRRRWRTPYGGLPYVPPTNTPLLTSLRTPYPIPSLCHTPYVCPPHTPSKDGGQLLSLFLYQIFDFFKVGPHFPKLLLLRVPIPCPHLYFCTKFSIFSKRGPYFQTRHHSNVPIPCPILYFCTKFSSPPTRHCHRHTVSLIKRRFS